MKIGIIGGGIAGLTAAYELAKQGHEVAVFEKETELGGQAGTFLIEGTRLERFYHHLFTSDRHILQLIDELGLSPRMRWIDSQVGLFHHGKVYDFVTPLDLLRFTPLSLPNRLWAGLVSIYLQRQADWRKYEGITAKEWLERYAGKSVYNAIWEPLLRSKFGDSYDEVSMTWFWGKMRLRFGSRPKGMQKEQLGYMEGSFQLLIAGLEKRIKEMGGEVYTNAPVERVVVEEGKATGLKFKVQSSKLTPLKKACSEARPRADFRTRGRLRELFSVDSKFKVPEEHPTWNLEPGTRNFDVIIATVPSFAFTEMVPELPSDYVGKLRHAKYQSALCLVLKMKQPLSHIYWMNISDPGIPFVAAIEHTNYMPPEVYGDKHVLYLSNYLPLGSPLFALSKDELLQKYLPHVQRINPKFDLDWVEESWLFRDDAGQPIITCHYSQQVPDHRTPIQGLYLANTSQIYPEDRGMNYSVHLGQKIASIVQAQ
ncbi:MAG: NAD(P)/FAD-dependent oxidoreductase [Anaerolineae bacterium]|nr:NAD(P)/FAD-dependent oxidoreductase [Anaerolineae bacterium]